MYSTNLAADICFPKMVADLYTQIGTFFPPKIIGIHFTVIMKIPGGTLLPKMSAELPSTEQIFTETSRLVTLKYEHSDLFSNCWFLPLNLSFKERKVETDKNRTGRH